MLTNSDLANPLYISSADDRGTAVGLTFVTARLFLILPLLIVVASVLQSWTDPAWLYLDTLEAVRRSGDCCHVYQGLISNLGVLLWAATSAICIFAAVLRLCTDRVTTSASILLFSGGILSGVLGLDDLFQVHEKVLPFLGISEPVTLLAYGLLLSLLTWSAIAASRIFDWPLFGLAIGLFVSSVLIDQFFHNSASIRIVIEDAAKFIGIASWFACLVSSAFRSLLLTDNGTNGAVRADGVGPQ